MTPDSISKRLFPIFMDGLESGIYDLPRDTSWSNLKTYHSPFVSIRLPGNWLELGSFGEIVESAFDGSGFYFPDEFNDKPIILGVFVLNWKGANLDDVRDSVIKDNRSNPDREFDPTFQDSLYSYNLPDGVKGYILHTRFLRKSKGLNQSRFELILFSEKYRKGFSVMISVQYADPSYKFDLDNSLSLFSARIFREVVVRK